MLSGHRVYLVVSTDGLALTKESCKKNMMLGIKLFILYRFKQKSRTGKENKLNGVNYLLIFSFIYTCFVTTACVLLVFKSFPVLSTRWQ